MFSTFEHLANPRSTAGKVISVILTISLALMMWDVNAMSYAFADDGSSQSAKSASKDDGAKDKAEKKEKAEKNL